MAALLLPSVSAADLAAYTVEGIEVEGASAIQGLLGVLHVDGVVSTPALEISAPSGLRVDHDFRNDTVTALSFGDPFPDPVRDLSSVSGRYTLASAASGTVLGAGHRPGHDLFIAPWGGQERPRIEVQSKDSWELRPSRTDTVQQKDFVGNNGTQDEISAEVGGSQWLTDSTGGRDITVTGSFVAVFWEWDLELDSPDVDPGRRQVRSGVAYGADPPATPPGTPPMVDDWVGDVAHLATSSNWTQTYVYVTDGTLRLTVEDARWLDVYLYAQEAGVEGRLTLMGALPLDGGLGASPQDKGFQGSLRAALGPGGDRIAVRFIPTTRLDASAPQGELPIESIRLDPSPAEAVAPGTVARHPPGALSLGAGLFAALVAVAAVAVARTALQRHRFARLGGLMEAQDYSAVVARSGPLVPTRRYGPKVSVMHAVSLLKTGRPSRASAFLAALPARSRPTPSAMAYLLACAEVLLGRRDEAARLLKECLRMDPSYAIEASLNTWFAPLVSHPELASWFGGGADPEGAYT